MSTTITAKSPGVASAGMRMVVVAMLLVVSLAGCTYDEDPAGDFERTCPSWSPGPGGGGAYSSPQGAMRHDADSPIANSRDPNDRNVFLARPGWADPVHRHGGTLDYLEFKVEGVTLVDSLLIIEVYRAADSEVQHKGTDPGPPPAPTGERLQFNTDRGGDGLITSQLVFGPHKGHDDPIINESAEVFVELQPAPSSWTRGQVHFEILYYGNQDGNNATDSVAGLNKATVSNFWYLHDDCIT